MLLPDRRIRRLAVHCADDLLGEASWRNATAPSPVEWYDATASSYTADVTCDARYWRVVLLDTFGTDASLSPRATVRQLRFFGVATPSPPPPPSPPRPPPPSPSAPIWVPDLVAREAERVACVGRELFALARERVAVRDHVNELPRLPSCEWSADDAIVAEGTVASLQPYVDGMQAPTSALQQPLDATASLATLLLPTGTYSMLIDHYFDRHFSRASRGEEPAAGLRGSWGRWSRGICALDPTRGDASTPGYGYRRWSARLYGIRGSRKHKADACFHYANRPYLFDRTFALAECSSNYFRTVGVAWVADPMCGECRSLYDENECPVVGESNRRRSSVASDSAYERDADGLRAEALGLAGRAPAGESGMNARLRATLRFGWPLRGFERCRSAQCNAEQEELLERWSFEVLGPKLEKLGRVASGVDMGYSFEPLVAATEAYEIISTDLTLAMLPWPLCFLYFLLYTGSVFLALAGTLQTMLAWPCALFVYRYVFGFGHVEELTLLASPLTASFTLDAMALLIDAWRMSAWQPMSVVSSLPARLNWVLREAGFACTHSIIVGVCAFSACAFSPWLPISHLGTFCALLLTVQLALSLLFLPLCLVLFHDQLEMKPNLCFFCCMAPAEGEARIGALQAIATLWNPQTLTSTEHHRDTRAIETSLGMAPDPARADASRGGGRFWPFPRYLSRAVVPWLVRPSRRRTLLLGFLALLVPVGLGVSQASSATRQRSRLFDTHPLLQAERQMDRSFEVSSLETTVRVTLLWGADGVDQSGVNLMRDSTYVGKIDWREGFAFDAATQAHVAAACDELKAQEWVRRDVSRATSTGTTGARAVQCFTDAFAAWLSNSTGSDDGFGSTFPVPDERDPALALHTFVNSPPGIEWQRYVAADSGRVYSVALSADLLLRESASTFEAQASADLVLALVGRLDGRAPPSAGRALPSTDSLWAWMRAQAALPAEAIGGSLRTAAVAAFALLFVTANLPLTLLTAFAVFSATMSLLALLVINGWALGSTEAVLACITPALLTPPAALVLRAYSKPANGDRVARSVYAFEFASATVCSGWLAIVIAIAPMLACQLMMEFKVAAALCFVALCACLWVGVCLPVLLGYLGPEPSAPGLPLVGSLPWLLVKTLPPKERVPIEGHAPATLSWYLARRRFQQEQAAAAIAVEEREAIAEERRQAKERRLAAKAARQAWSKNVLQRAGDTGSPACGGSFKSRSPVGGSFNKHSPAGGSFNSGSTPGDSFSNGKGLAGKLQQDSMTRQDSRATRAAKSKGTVYA